MSCAIIRAMVLLRRLPMEANWAGLSLTKLVRVTIRYWLLLIVVSMERLDLKLSLSDWRY